VELRVSRFPAVRDQVAQSLLVALQRHDGIGPLLQTTRTKTASWRDGQLVALAKKK
jgi:hypothetical protein